MKKWVSLKVLINNLLKEINVDYLVVNEFNAKIYQNLFDFFIVILHKLNNQQWDYETAMFYWKSEITIQSYLNWIKVFYGNGKKWNS